MAGHVEDYAFSPPIGPFSRVAFTFTENVASKTMHVKPVQAWIVKLWLGLGALIYSGQRVYMTRMSLHTSRSATPLDSTGLLRNSCEGVKTPRFCTVLGGQARC